MLENVDSGAAPVYRQGTDIRSQSNLKPEILAMMRSLNEFARSKSSHARCDAITGSDTQTDAMDSASELPDLTGWYVPLLAIYKNLEQISAINDHHLTRAVMSESEVQGLLPNLYALRARYETDFEFELAQTTIASKNSGKLIASQVDEKIRVLPDAYFRVMRSADRILFAGSGPLPTTALALAKVFNRPITCIDYNADANAVAGEYVKLSGCANRITFIDGDILEFDGFHRFDCIAGAFLLGMSTAPVPVSTKSEFVKQLLKIIDGKISLVLRTSRGLGGIIYPLIDFATNRQFRQVEYPLQPGQSQPYDSTFVTWN